ncbi:DNRLRE domain-containing protein [Tumebacillus sp. DT12]|uniref:DNRLRE domain-containing protein n=1 Tax=Tumebacillus lacus TaxID=2995335 RepID=A0ABT3WZX8_9BACL|nr:DNRLRE domain-containing protein [Tumebacillus lacus]MCX7568896.1 DNRLRE domain-containing protein [Tumebacillus lacus]
MSSKWKSSSQFLSLFLSTCLVANAACTPNAEAAGAIKSQGDQSAMNAVIGEMPNKLPKERLELTSKRTKYSTTYLNPDGSFTEEISLEAQHYLDASGKEWKKIDNKLKASNQKTGFVNGSNAFNIWFADQSGANELVSVEKGGKSVGLIPVGAKQAKGAVKGDEITYAGAFENADVRYQAQGEGVKEDLILHALPKQATFSFELKQKGVKATVEKDGTIALADQNGEKVWYFEKPFMTDAEGKYSQKVDMNLREANGKTYVDVTPDAAFLQDKTTKFPVTIDPTINNWDVLRDTFISSAFPDASYGSETFLTTGYHGYFGATRSLAQFYLSSMPSDAKISSATLNLYQQKTDATNTSIDLHRITSAWGSNTTWNTQPEIKTTAETTTTNYTANAYWTMYATQLVKDWYNGVTPNYGFLLKQQNETTSPYRTFTSVNAGNNTPRLTITYTVDAIGLEEFWGYSKDGVNVSNGNLVLQETDLSIQGRGVPVELKRTHNSRRMAVAGLFGYGWQTNWDMQLVDSGSGPITLIDGDGTRHIFGQRADGVYKANGGVYLDLVKNADGTYVITKPDGTAINFATSGKLASLADTNGNATTFQYDASGKLTSVKDASGRTTTLAYNAAGYVSTLTDPANRITRYEYDATGNLSKKVDAANAATSYAYDANRNMTALTDARGYATTYTYDANDRVTTVARPITIGTVKQTGTTTYAYDMTNLITSVTDAEGKRIDYTYNANGNVVQTIENPLDEANKAVTTYAYDNNNNLTQVKDPNANKNGGTEAYVYSYDAKGNVTAVQLPGSQRADYGYNGQNDLTSVEDFNNNVSSFAYDARSNQTEASDAYAQTTSNRYLANGNIDYTTHAMSVADNLVTNSSFEQDGNGDNWPDNWSKQIEPGKTATITTEAGGKYGTKSVSISNPTGWALAASDSMIPYTAGTPYVVSGFMKLDGVTNGALVKLEFFDTNQNWLGQQQSFVMKGTHDWTRLQAVVDNAPANTAKVRVAVGMNAGPGTAHFDGIQLEKGTVLSAYNLLENSSFELDANVDKMPDFWTHSGNLSANDSLVQSVSGDDNAYAGANSFKLTGEAGKNKFIKQRINLSGVAGERFTLSGWSKQTGADPNGGYYNMQVAINHADGTTDWTNANAFDKTDTNWQHVAAEVTAQKAFQSVDVYYYYYNQTGAALFDAVRFEQGASHSSYSYDAAGNYITAEKSPAGTTFKSSYDAVGNKISATDGKGAQTFYQYEGRNLLTKVTDANSGITSYGYDGTGNRTSMVDAKNNTTSYVYNEWNLLSKITNSLNQSISMEYDRNGNETKVTYPSGNTVGQSYNARNLVDGIYHNGVKKWSATYHPSGSLASVTDAAGSTTSFVYDKNDRLIQQVTGANQLDFGFDDNNNQTSVKMTSGTVSVTAGAEFNPLNQLTALARNGVKQAKFIYDERGNVTSVIYSNGSYTSYLYDEANRLKALKNYTVNGAVLNSHAYSYDANDNIIGIATETGNYAYEYDSLHQLLKETHPDGTAIRYVYDAVGNRTKKEVTKGTAVTATAYTYDAGNQLTAVNGQAYQYDANGNLTHNGANTFVYDAGNRLTQVKNAQGTVIASYEYDYQGKRIGATTSAGTTKFHYNGTKVMFETDANGQINAEYTWDEEGNPVTMTKGGQTYYYHVNGHGDVTGLTDAAGNVVAEYRYDAWGNILSQSGAMASANPYRYAGYRYEEATKMYYLLARYYDPNTGRFITRDTFHGVEDVPLSLNQYAYAHNNPVMNIDPNGHLSWKEATKKLFNRIVSSLANDWRSNTLTNVFFTFMGGGIGGGLAYKAARAGFTLLERHVLRKSVIGFIKGAIGGYLFGVTSQIGKILGAGNKLTNFEGAFDRTSLGRAVDNAITRAERSLKGMISRW